jgi:hypothetical protein
MVRVVCLINITFMQVMAVFMELFPLDEDSTSLPSGCATAAEDSGRDKYYLAVRPFEQIVIAKLKASKLPKKLALEEVDGELTFCSIPLQQHVVATNHWELVEAATVIGMLHTCCLLLMVGLSSAFLCHYSNYALFTTELTTSSEVVYLGQTFSHPALQAKGMSARALLLGSILRRQLPALQCLLEQVWKILLS